MKSGTCLSLIMIVLLPLMGCVAPLPVKSVDDPWVQGRIESSGSGLANIEIWIDHEDYAACRKPKSKTLTDEDGKFEFPGQLRSWTWLGWANNHYVSLCVLGPDGAIPYGFVSINDPETIEITCELSKQLGEMCSFDCANKTIDGRC